MKKQVNPIVAVVLVLVALGAVYYCYNNVFSGKIEGQLGPPGAAASKMPGAPPMPQPKGPGMMTGPNSPHPGVAKPSDHKAAADTKKPE